MIIGRRSFNIAALSFGAAIVLGTVYEMIKKPSGVIRVSSPTTTSLAWMKISGDLVTLNTLGHRVSIFSPDAKPLSKINGQFGFDLKLVLLSDGRDVILPSTGSVGGAPAAFSVRDLMTGQTRVDVGLPLDLTVSRPPTVMGSSDQTICLYFQREHKSTIVLLSTASFEVKASFDIEVDRGIVTACAFSPDGLHVALGMISGLVTIYEVANPQNSKMVRAAPDPTREVTCLSFGPDGEALIFGSAFNFHARNQDSSKSISCGIIHTKKSKAITPLVLFPRLVASVAWRNDGNLIAALDVSGSLATWDQKLRLVSNTSVLTSGSPPAQMAFSPNNEHLAACGGSEAVIVPVSLLEGSSS